MSSSIENELLKRVDGYIEFDGQNCNDYRSDDQEECAGWDGESRRCQCGNRRVHWELRIGGDPNNPEDYYAEAF